MDDVMQQRISDREGESGVAIIVALSFLSVLMIMTSVFVSNLISSSNFEASLEMQTKSLYIAEAGLTHAVWKLDRLGTEYRGESGIRFADGSFDIALENYPADPKKKIVISRARLDGYAGKRSMREIRAIVSLRVSPAGKSGVIIDSWEMMD
jgi:hypothetical protein